MPQAMKHGALAILPLVLGAAVYGFAFGLLAAQVGFPWWGVGLMIIVGALSGLAACVVRKQSSDERHILGRNRAIGRCGILDPRRGTVCGGSYPGVTTRLDAG